MFRWDFIELIIGCMIGLTGCLYGLLILFALEWLNWLSSRKEHSPFNVKTNWIIIDRGSLHKSLLQEATVFILLQPRIIIPLVLLILWTLRQVACMITLRTSIWLSALTTLTFDLPFDCINNTIDLMPGEFGQITLRRHGKEGINNNFAFA